MKWLYFFVLVLTNGTVGLYAQKADTTMIIKDIDQVSVHISSHALMAPSDDIKKLWASCRHSHVIGLGEGTHGTSEFYALKNRIIKFGVAQKGFRLILVEESFSNVIRLNEYIRQGKGTAKEGLSAFGAWIYKTKEVLELVEYLRAYNRDKAEDEKVSLLGFDVQSVSGVISELKHNPTYDKTLIADALSRLDSLDQHYALYDAWNDGVQSDIKTVLSYLKGLGHQPGYNKSTIKLMILQLEYGMTLWVNKKSWEEFGAKRDSLMACSVIEVMRITDSPKVFLWGHNGHIMKYQVDAYKTMGLVLSEKLGKAYFGIGFDFNKGCFKAFDMKERKHTDFCVEDAESGTTAAVFRRSKHKMFFLDLKKSMNTRFLSQFLLYKPHYRQVQATYDSLEKASAYTGFDERISLWTFYDGWIYVDQTKASAFYE